jgi:hypothetical protein
MRKPVPRKQERLTGDERLHLAVQRLQLALVGRLEALEHRPQQLQVIQWILHTAIIVSREWRASDADMPCSPWPAAASM